MKQGNQFYLEFQIEDENGVSLDTASVLKVQFVIDNLIKTYTDMLKGALLYDDSIIYKGVSEKYYSVKPRIEITIQYMTDFDSDFNKKKILK